MSASHLVIDVESLQEVAKSLQNYVATSQADLQNAMQGLQAAEGCWSDEDMRQLQQSLSFFYSEVERIGQQGMTLMNRCDQKIEALGNLHSMNI